MDLKQPKALTGRFALIFGAIIAIAGIALFYGSRQNSVFDLRVMAERNNVALTRAFANAILPRYADFIDQAARYDAETLRRHPTTAALRADTIEQMQGLDVLKVKIYDLEGLTVFSTEAAQIGEDKSANAGFLSARKGHVVSELTHRDTFSAFEQEIEDRDVLSSYIPVTNSSGEVEGVFEVYYDLTALLARIERSAINQFFVVAATLALLYLLVLAIVRQRDRDVARRYQENVALAAEAAAASEQSLMKSEFLANMSHELRTPLNAILGFSDTMRSQIFGPIGSEKYRTYLDDIWNSGQHLLGIVDDVLDMSKIETGTMDLNESELRVESIFDQCIRMMTPAADQKKIRLVPRLPRESVRLTGDERRINQMLLNVVSNAVKFSPEGGRIDIAARLHDNGRLEIAVTDQGCGIAKSDIRRVLKPFGQVASSYARDHGGTGLGLPISKSFAELHGGTLTIDSAEKKGTTVTIVFPAERVRRPGASAPSPVAA